MAILNPIHLNPEIPDSVFTPKRVIFVGDIQGCYDELMDLLKEVDYVSAEDQLVCVGDMLNKGPNSLAVANFLMAEPHATCLLGNHEWFFINEGKKKKSFQKLSQHLGSSEDRVKAWLKSLPLFIETEDWMAIHGGLLPHQHPSEMDPETLTTLRRLPDGRPWFEATEPNKDLIFGHWAVMGLVQHGRIWGLDSGCVYGGYLSALVWPERRVVSVPARDAYVVPKALKATP
jgi:bis(5'-nucleosyl)-tetraphosphatase (symmetrical)